MNTALGWQGKSGAREKRGARWNIPASFTALPAEYPSLYGCSLGVGTTASAIISPPANCCDGCEPNPDQVKAIYGELLSNIADVGIDKGLQGLLRVLALLSDRLLRGQPGDVQPAAAVGAGAGP